MSARTLDDLDFSDKRVLVRVDFNVPLSDDEPRSVTDDTRIRAALPTIRKILDGGGTPVLMSHLGRPKGAFDPAFSLRPVAEHLAGLLESPVVFVPELTGPETERTVRGAAPGTVLLLENTRFDDREKANDPELARALARLGDAYVNDAFGSAHRAHASTAGVTDHFGEKAMGALLAREIEYLGRGLAEPKHPFVAVLGGAKVSDKIGVIEALLDQVDALLIGGAMSYTFLKMLGHEVGTSLVEEDKLEVARTLYDQAGGRIHLPSDHVVADAFANDADRRTVSGDIPDEYMGLDIGPDTIAAYGDIIRNAKTVIWNGPMGVFEFPNFADGTRAVAAALVDATRNGALTIVGGGDSVAAITQAGLEDEVSHVSTGGGAMLEFLEGKTLPGVAALDDDA